jgi:SAM-dependent methyltransferase
MHQTALSPWSAPAMVRGFATAAPNPTLIHYAATQLNFGSRDLLDIGCGAGRNAVPLARMGWRVAGMDLSRPMLQAAVARDGYDRLKPMLGAMDALPIRGGSVDLIVAHGIWNLARSTGEFRRAVAEAARVARRGAALFVFTFSRNTLPSTATAVPGEPFVFTQFAGEPQCFLTEAQLLAELQAVGFRPDPSLPIRELNLPAPGSLRTGAPVIFEGGFLYL